MEYARGLFRGPGITYAKFSWLQAWHIRDETYSAALAELTNSQFYHPFVSNWLGTHKFDSDYVWRQGKVMEKGEFRPLQRQQNP